MRPLIGVACYAAVLPIYAGVVQGIALENATSSPLARTRIRLEKVEGGQRRTISTAITAGLGQFFFTGIPDGLYVLTATRASYAATIFKSKPNDLRSAVFEVRADSDVFAEIRIPKLGVITGRILDDNRVGIAGLRVMAYPARVPLKIAAEAKTDDRGANRIYGLDPGKFYIRTEAHQLEDGPGLLPSFFPHGTAIKDARSVAATLDRETTDIDMRPIEGQLSRVTVTANCPGSATLVLSADIGRQQRTAACGQPSVFMNLAPGEYELLAHAPGLAAHQFVHLDRDVMVGLDLKDLPRVDAEFNPRELTVPVQARRRDLAGEGESVTLTERPTTLLPGTWEFTARVPPDRYVVRIGEWRFLRGRVQPDAEWFPVYMEAARRHALNVETAVGAGTVSGRVSLRGEPAASAPVYLYPLTPETRQQMGGNRIVFSDPQGRYQLTGVAPGKYLVAAVFDVFDVSGEALLSRGAVEVTIEARQNASRDLTLPDE